MGEESFIVTVERERDGVAVASWWFHDEGRWVVMMGQ
jgi:hypothetical protein